MGLPYKRLAALYDGLMDEVDYQHWATYLQALAGQYQSTGKRLLDLGCGTGTITLQLAALGYDVIGVDLSPDMLAVAADKGLAANLSPSRWRCQDMRELRFQQNSFDVVVCACDGINYLADSEDLRRTFVGVANCLQAGGLLLFDLHSEYKMQHVFCNQQYVLESDTGYCIWTSAFDGESNDCTHEMVLFTHQRDDLYRCSQEVHHQHFFPLAEVGVALEQAGLELLAVHEWGTLSAPRDTTERWQLVARKR